VATASWTTGIHMIQQNTSNTMSTNYLTIWCENPKVQQHQSLPLNTVLRLLHPPSILMPYLHKIYRISSVFKVAAFHEVSPSKVRVNLPSSLHNLYAQPLITSSI
jgi:hypothetical protein